MHFSSSYIRVRVIFEFAVFTRLYGIWHIHFCRFGENVPCSVTNCPIQCKGNFFTTIKTILYLLLKGAWLFKFLQRQIGGIPKCGDFWKILPICMFGCPKLRSPKREYNLLGYFKFSLFWIMSSLVNILDTSELDFIGKVTTGLRSNFRLQKWKMAK